MTIDFDPGWLTVPELVDLAEIDELLLQVQRLRQVPESQRLVGDKPHAGTHHLAELEQRIELVADIVTRPKLVAAVGTFIDLTNAGLRASYRSPQPGFGAQKLHADGLAKLIDGPGQIATAIVALVDFTTTNGATRLVPNSHRRPDLQRHSGTLDDHVNEIPMTGPAGTAFVFSGHLLHAGANNASTEPRPALQLQWAVLGASIS